MGYYEKLQRVNRPTKVTKILTTNFGPKVDIIGTCGDLIGDMDHYIDLGKLLTPNPWSTPYPVQIVIVPILGNPI